ncbi:DUF3872 domain-containing protein [Chryseobacterium sp. MMS23-Vi53]|uniref:DUF3872 domain-containing protein n=1 Tax=Chryseobacterium sp. MMS23-Vi53 TaxID=3386644 RepID=UPI0039ED32DE
MKNLIVSTLYIIISLISIELFFTSCSEDELQIQKNFPFEVQFLPVQKYIAKGETVEIRCRIIPTGNYAGTSYSIRYFQPNGAGNLRLFNDLPFVPNNVYPLSEKEFRLYYTSESTVSQSFDIRISDNMGNEKKLSFQFDPSNIVSL